jgi:hypothetical protein
MDWAHTGVLGLINNLAGLLLLVSIVLGLAGLLISPFRGFCGLIIYLSSYVMGISTWLWCAQVVHTCWGTVAMVIGLLFFGVGVAPMAMIAAPLHGYWAVDVGIVLSLATVFGARIFGNWMIENKNSRSRETTDYPIIDVEATTL